MAKYFPNILLKASPQIQQIQSFPRRATPRDIIVKLLKTNDKVIKRIREKCLIIYKQQYD